MDNTTNTTTTTAKPFVIRLTLVGRRKVRYLKSYRAARALTVETMGKNRRARITTTDFRNNARGFATLEEAQAFIDTHAAGFGYHFEAVAR